MTWISDSITSLPPRVRALATILAASVLLLAVLLGGQLFLGGVPFSDVDWLSIGISVLSLIAYSVLALGLARIFPPAWAVAGGVVFLLLDLQRLLGFDLPIGSVILDGRIDVRVSTAALLLVAAYAGRKQRRSKTGSTDAPPGARAR